MNGKKDKNLQRISLRLKNMSRTIFQIGHNLWSKMQYIFKLLHQHCVGNFTVQDVTKLNRIVWINGQDLQDAQDENSSQHPVNPVHPVKYLPAQSWGDFYLICLHYITYVNLDQHISNDKKSQESWQKLEFIIFSMFRLKTLQISRYGQTKKITVSQERNCSMKKYFQKWMSLTGSS